MIEQRGREQARDRKRQDQRARGRRFRAAIETRREAPLRHEQAREEHESGNAELHHHQQDLIVRILRDGRAGAVEAIRVGLAEAAGADAQHRAAADDCQRVLQELETQANR